MDSENLPLLKKNFDQPECLRSFLHTGIIIGLPSILSTLLILLNSNSASKEITILLLGNSFLFFLLLIAFIAELCQQSASTLNIGLGIILVLILWSFLGTVIVIERDEDYEDNFEIWLLCLILVCSGIIVEVLMILSYIIINLQSMVLGLKLKHENKSADTLY